VSSRRMTFRRIVRATENRRETSRQPGLQP
jgi:hypothetical protein